MSNLSGIQVEDASSSILIKIKRTPNFKYSPVEKPLLELPMKFKTLISYKSRYMKIFENFILIFKVIRNFAITQFLFVLVEILSEACFRDIFWWGSPLGVGPSLRLSVHKERGEHGVLPLRDERFLGFTANSEPEVQSIEFPRELQGHQENRQG